MVIECPKLNPYRDSCGIGPFVRAHQRSTPGISSLKLFSLYMNDNRPDSVRGKAMDLYNMKVGWHILMKINFKTPKIQQVF